LIEWLTFDDQLALEYGVALVPVYSFGETDMYTTYSFLFKLRWWICKNLRMAIPLCRGRGLSIIPRRVPVSETQTASVLVNPRPCHTYTCYSMRRSFPQFSALSALFHFSALLNPHLHLGEIIPVDKIVSQPK
jgi:hypothetical protein